MSKIIVRKQEYANNGTHADEIKAVVRDDLVVNTLSSATDLVPSVGLVKSETDAIKDALSNSLIFSQNAKCVEFLVSSNNWCSIRIYTDYTHQNGYSIDLADTGSFSLFKWVNGTATKMWQK